MSILKYTPNLSSEEAKRLAEKHFGIKVENSKPLPSERDQNFRLTTDDRRQYVLKIANGQEQREFLEAQNSMISHIAQRVDVVAKPVAATNGKQIIDIVKGDSSHFVRLVPFLEGDPLASFPHRNVEWLADLGRCTGRIHKALQVSPAAV